MHSECSKVSYYQPKSQHFFWIINQQPKFICAIFFSKINSDAHFGTKKYIHILQGGSGGDGGWVIALRSKRNVKNGGFTFLQQILHTRREDISCNDVDSDSCKGGCRFFFVLKRCNTSGRILSVPKYVLISLKFNNFKSNFPL